MEETDGWMALEFCVTQFCTPQRELRALRACVQILATSTTLKAKLEELFRVLREELNMLHGIVMLLSPTGTELVLAAADAPEDVPEGTAPVRYARGEGMLGEVLLTGGSTIVPRVSQEPRFCDKVHQRRGKKLGELSFIGVPIFMEGQIVGALSVDLPYHPDTPLAQREQFLSIVASMIAADIQARRHADLEREALAAENQRLRQRVEERSRPTNIVGNSGMMRDVYARIGQVADYETTVLIRGESGTGKELVAAAIHYSGARAPRPFVKVNCAALNEHLLDSELFGHEKGSFTGAMQTRIGRLEEAQGGTLFLDEIGEFSPALQIKLLRVLQEREFQRLGSNETRKTEVRIIGATNRDLEEAVEQGRFRQDFYYRINVFPIVLPPLRERRDDILLLANHFVVKYATKMGKDIRRINTPAINMLMAYHWPGNVRELENCMEHAVLLAENQVIQGHHLPPTLQMPDADELTAGSLPGRVALLERDLIVDALKNNAGSIPTSARMLEITPRMLRYKIKKLGIDLRALTRELKE